MEATNNTRRSFLCMNAGTSKNRKNEKMPYVFHCEGNVTFVGTFLPADGDKQAVLNLSVAVGRNPWLMLGKDAADEQAGNPDINADKPFINLAVFGPDAERLQGIQKGAKILFRGRPEKNPYKKKSGEDAVSLRVIADAVYQLPSKNGSADSISPAVTSRLNCYESGGKENEQLVGMVSGKVLSVESLRTTSAGKEVISAKLELAVPALEAAARINRTYDEKTNYGTYKTVSIAVWGARATHMDRILVPGAELVVTGSAGTNKGKDNREYVNISVRELSVLKWANPGSSAENSDSDAASETGSAPAANLDDLASAAGVDLPF